jgi:hypothetical protein
LGGVTLLLLALVTIKRKAIWYSAPHDDRVSSGGRELSGRTLDAYQNFDRVN